MVVTNDEHNGDKISDNNNKKNQQQPLGGSITDTASDFVLMMTK